MAEPRDESTTTQIETVEPWVRCRGTYVTPAHAEILHKGDKCPVCEMWREIHRSTSQLVKNVDEWVARLGRQMLS